MKYRTTIHYNLVYGDGTVDSGATITGIAVMGAFKRIQREIQLKVFGPGDRGLRRVQINLTVQAED